MLLVPTFSAMVGLTKRFSGTKQGLRRLINKNDTTVTSVYEKTTQHLRRLNKKPTQALS